MIRCDIRPPDVEGRTLREILASEPVVVGVEPKWIEARMVMVEEALRLALGAEVGAVAVTDGAGGRLCQQSRAKQSDRKDRDDEATRDRHEQSGPPVLSTRVVPRQYLRPRELQLAASNSSAGDRDADKDAAGALQPCRAILEAVQAQGSRPLAADTGDGGGPDRQNERSRDSGQPLRRERDAQGQQGGGEQ